MTIIFTIIIIPKANTKWLALLLLIREVTDSNLCPKTGYPDSVS
jgi:hypothetical protein